MKNIQPKSLPIILIYILCAFIMPFPLAEGMRLLAANGILPNLSDTEIAMCINVLVYLFLPLCAMIYYRHKLAADTRGMGKKIVLVLPLILMVYGASILGGLFVPFLDHTTTTQNQSYLENLKEMNFYFTTYMAVVAAPVTEESVFRCALIKNHRGFWGFLMLVVSSALFSLAHSQDLAPGAFLAYFSIALVLGGIYLYHRNLVLNILVHAGYNALALVLASFLKI